MKANVSNQELPLEADNNGEGRKIRKTAVRQSDVPRHDLRDALRVPQAIRDNFAKKPTKPLNVAMALNMSPGSSVFKMLLGASAAYGLTEGSHTSAIVSITDLGRRIVAPTAEGMEEKASREAFLKPRVINEFLTKYNDSRLPSEKIANNVLAELGVPLDSVAATFKVIVDGSKNLGLIREHKGNWYVNLDIESTYSSETSDDEEVEEDEAATEVPQERRSMTRDAGRLPDTYPQVNNRVFITHGKNVDIVSQLKELLAFGSFVPVVAAENESVSKPVPDKVMDDMRSCYAAIIHVGKEIKLLDNAGDEHIFLNQNVLIEIGAAMALYNRRFILLVERGATLPSNLQGLYEVRYEGNKLDYDATMKLLKAFNDFKG